MNKDCINDIKDLLSHLWNDNNECRLFDELSPKFFGRFLRDDDRFKTPNFSSDIAYVTIELLTYHQNKDKIYPIGISYCYDADRDGEDWVSYTFTDEDVTYDYDWQKPHDNLNYSDIPDEVWESIKAYVYKEVKRKLNDEVKTAEDIYLHKAKENYVEALDKYNKLIEKYERNENKR